MPILFRYPEFFLLLIPLGLAFRRWGRTRDRVTNGLRILASFLLLLALTGPEINLGGEGQDVIVIVDRSRSMQDAAGANAVELIENLERNRGPGDRVGIVSFGGTAEVERLPSEQALFRGFEKDVSIEGSDLNAAILTSLGMVDPNRPARLLVLSDGEFNGADPKAAARRARDQDPDRPVPIDYRAYDRIRAGDIAVEELTLPRTIAPREPFHFTVQVFADRETPATVEVTRDGQPVAARQVQLVSGQSNPVAFRDVLDEGGFYTYEARIIVENDPIPENNRGTGVVRVDAEAKLLVLNADGQVNNLVKALRAGKIPVDVAAAKLHPLSQDSLDPYRAVILENVPADDLGRLKMERLAQYVEDLGGGLMLTGGEQSYGTGGYYKSPLEDVLPVSMELKDEHKTLRVAICIALDQSGSMSAPVQGGRTKMDLANQGTAEVVKLLSKEDMVSVLSVNTSAHSVQELTRVLDLESIINRIEGIRSQGGGIYVYEALEAAGEELAKAREYRTRHIILFSDASDSVNPGGYERLLKGYEEEGISVSVIGLGTEHDPHAELLKDIARLGGGNIMFTDDPEELPRLFTQDTMQVARNTFIKKDESQPAGISGELFPEEARLMGEFDFGPFPRVDGYNLTYLKPDATQSAVSSDEYRAPWAAFWYRGLGRSAAVTMEVAGEYTGEFGRWSFYDEFLINHARWLMGGNSTSDVYIDLKREGQNALVTVELDPNRLAGLAKKPPKLFVVPPGLEREPALLPDFRWTGPYTLEARFRMDQTGTYRTPVESPNGELTRGPAVTLPYSPEAAPRPQGETGRQILAELAELTGGKSRADVLSILADPPSSARMRPLLPYLLIAAIVLVVVEIAGRRLSLWKRSPASSADAVTELSLDPALSYKERWFSRKRKQPVEPVATDTKQGGSRKADRSIDHVYAQAKQRARNRLGNE